MNMDVDCFQDGGSRIDTSYQTSRDLNITWSVNDPESDIKYCEWALGKYFTYCWCIALNELLLMIRTHNLL